MQFRFTECPPDYSTYSFPYKVHCLAESKEEYSQIYDLGFLPYTGDWSIEESIFYLARSLRIQLSEFKDSSENRRIDRKMAELAVQYELIPLAEFDTNDVDFRAFCFRFAQERFKQGSMSAERLDYVVSRSYLSHILCFKSAEKVLGYVFVVLDNAQTFFHYWFAFYDIQFLTSHSLGKWMMWKCIKIAQEMQLKHVYLGTAYGSAALYKIRDHHALSFFDGRGWNSDKKHLIRLCKNVI